MMNKSSIYYIQSTKYLVLNIQSECATVKDYK